MAIRESYNDGDRMLMAKHNIVIFEMLLTLPAVYIHIIYIILPDG